MFYVSLWIGWSFKSTGWLAIIILWWRPDRYPLVLIRLCSWMSLKTLWELVSFWRTQHMLLQSGWETVKSEIHWAAKTLLCKSWTETYRELSVFRPGDYNKMKKFETLWLIIKGCLNFEIRQHHLMPSLLNYILNLVL